MRGEDLRTSRVLVFRTGAVAPAPRLAPTDVRYERTSLPPGGGCGAATLAFRPCDAAAQDAALRRYLEQGWEVEQTVTRRIGVREETTHLLRRRVGG